MLLTKRPCFRHLYYKLAMFLVGKIEIIKHILQCLADSDFQPYAFKPQYMTKEIQRKEAEAAAAFGGWVSEARMQCIFSTCKHCWYSYASRERILLTIGQYCTH